MYYAYLKCLEKHGFYCTAIIGENGSKDETRLMIEQAAGPRIALLDTSAMAKSQSRLKRMAIGRQALLDAAKARDIGEDYICVMDLDNMTAMSPAPLAVKAAINCLQTNTTLFAIGATSIPVYYDLLSLRVQGYDNLSNLNTEITEAKKKPFSYYQFHKEHIYNNQKLMTSTAPILCASSFNGFCLYNAEDYRLGSYRARDETDVCEHVSLNLSIGHITGKKMMISPDLVIQAPEDHAPVGFFRFWSDRMKKGLDTFRI
jgi:hypothetical protein